MFVLGTIAVISFSPVMLLPPIVVRIGGDRPFTDLAPRRQDERHRGKHDLRRCHRILLCILWNNPVQAERLPRRAAASLSIHARRFPKRSAARTEHGSGPISGRWTPRCDPRNM